MCHPACYDIQKYTYVQVYKWTFLHVIIVVWQYYNTYYVKNDATYNSQAALHCEQLQTALISNFE